MTRAVVLAYHSVGVRCLKVLIRHGIEIPLVITHQDSPTENIWFESVAALCQSQGIPVATPDDINTPEWIERIRALEPDYLFSFYFRQMLKPELLSIPKAGALNMHGSLLPKYRGRVPINWAVIHGETETGATLHEMTEKPDQGAILGREKVSIGPDETAHEVFLKVTDAAETLLDRLLPSLIDGTAPREMQDLKAGSYFSGRKPEDGRIDWSLPISAIHNLVRGVAPPYPGAFTDIGQHRLRILKTRKFTVTPSGEDGVSLKISADSVVVESGTAEALQVLEFDLDGEILTPEALQKRLGSRVQLYPRAATV